MHTEPATLPELRARAHAKGYTIHYPGFYCPKATLCATYVTGESFEVQMGDALAGLRELESIIEGLPALTRSE